MSEERQQYCIRRILDLRISFHLLGRLASEELPTELEETFYDLAALIRSCSQEIDQLERELGIHTSLVIHQDDYSLAVTWRQ
jgi:hypothetical protein